MLDQASDRTHDMRHVLLRQLLFLSEFNAQRGPVLEEFRKHLVTKLTMKEELLVGLPACFE